MSRSVTVYTGDITRAVAREELLPETIVARVFSATLKTLRKELARGRKVQLTGFGTFYLSRRSASRGRNFQTQELMDIPAMTLPRFSAGDGLKRAVRRKKQ
jgi:DNA-binding protein HU-beta